MKNEDAIQVTTRLIEYREALANKMEELDTKRSEIEVIKTAISNINENVKRETELLGMWITDQPEVLK